MNKALPLCFALAAACAAFGASAQNLKPGLWEVQHKMKGNPEMERQMEEARVRLAEQRSWLDVDEPHAR